MASKIEELTMEALALAWSHFDVETWRARAAMQEFLEKNFYMKPQSVTLTCSVHNTPFGHTIGTCSYAHIGNGCKIKLDKTGKVG